MQNAIRQFIVLSLALLFGARSHAQSCDAGIIEALKSQRREQTESTVVQMVQQSACEAHDKGTYIAIPYASYSATDVGQACSSNNSQFFERHYQELALSILPDRAFETIEAICGTKALSVRVQRTGDSVDLSADWGGVAGIAVVSVKGVRWSDNVATCAGDLIRTAGKPLPRLRVGVGLGATCKIDPASKADGFITVATSAGRKTAKIFSFHHYKLLGYVADDYLYCYLDGKTVMTLPVSWPGDFNHPPIQTVNLDPYLTKRGDHVLQCKDVETIGYGGHPCWKYKFEVTRDDEVLSTQALYSCDAGSLAQPPPIAPLTIRTE